MKPLSAARKKLRREESLQCPAYLSPLLAYDDWESETGMSGGILDRADFDYARMLIGRPASEYEEKTSTPDGWCIIPKHEPYVGPTRFDPPRGDANSCARRTTLCSHGMAAVSQKTHTLPPRSLSPFRTVSWFTMSLAFGSISSVASMARAMT